MNKHKVTLKDGTVATRNSKTRIYTHVTAIAGNGTASNRHDGVIRWHMSHEAAYGYASSREARQLAEHYEGELYIHPVPKP